MEAQHCVDEFHLIKRGRVTRLPQNSYAGEVIAVLEALNTYQQVAIYSDCQAVVQQLQQILERPDHNDQKKGGQYAAAWSAIQSHVRQRSPGQITIQKVKAHQDIARLEDIMCQRWLAKGNQSADHHAKQVKGTDAARAYSQRAQVHERQITMLQ